MRGDSGASPHVGTDPVSVRLHANSVYRPHAISGIIDPNIHPVLTGGADRHGVCPYMRPIGRVGVYVYRNGSIRRTIFVRVLQIKSFLIFSYIDCREGTKNITPEIAIPLVFPLVCVTSTRA